MNADAAYNFDCFYEVVPDELVNESYENYDFTNGQSVGHYYSPSFIHEEMLPICCYEDFTEGQNIVNVVPNPNNGNFVINSEKEINQISIFNFHNQQLLHLENINLKSTGNLDFDKLQEGIHQVIVKYRDGTYAHSRIIVR